MVDKNSSELLELFKQISAKRWIPGVSNGWGGIGLTFEKEINKLPDSKYDPDYADIEIKCTSRYSLYPLFLFTIAFDGPGENEIMRLVDKYGHYDGSYSDKKVLYRKIASEINPTYKYNFLFEVDRDEELIYLCIYDADGVLIERQSYLTFDSLKKHVNTKLKKLALIRASIKNIDNEKYYRYYAISFYKLLGFDKFLELIENNVLQINIVSRIGKSGQFSGKYKNRNIEFSIKKEDISKLFECYMRYNHDTNY